MAAGISTSREARILRRDPEFAALAEAVLRDPRYDALRRLRHHDATLADHSVSVAWLSYRLARLLGLRSRLPQVTRGALLHDFFLYDWRAERPPGGGLHGLVHPRVAEANADSAFGPLSRRERDCIRSHMWPLTPIPPRYGESLVVCVADKVVSLRESLASLRNGTGLGVL